MRGRIAHPTFGVLGVIFMNTDVAEKIGPNALVVTVITAVIVAGSGLAGWFLFV